MVRENVKRRNDNNLKIFKDEFEYKINSKTYCELIPILDSY